MLVCNYLSLQCKSWNLFVIVNAIKLVFERNNILLKQIQITTLFKRDLEEIMSERFDRSNFQFRKTVGYLLQGKY